MSRLLQWLSRHKSAVAAAAALFVVWRVARFAIGSTWVLAGWDDIASVGGWATDHWVWFGIALAALFLVVFVLVRAVIPWLEARDRRS